MRSTSFLAAAAAATVLSDSAVAGGGGGGRAPMTHCTGLDYVVRRGACTEGHRKVDWVKRPRLEAWDCAGREIIDDAHAGCDCHPDDYTADYDPHGRVLLGWRLRDGAACDAKSATGLNERAVQGLPAGATLPACTPYDVGYEYTPCDAATDTQEIVAYWTTRCRTGQEHVVDLARWVGAPQTSSSGSLRVVLTKRAEALTASAESTLLFEPDAHGWVLRAVGARMAFLEPLIGHRLTAVTDSHGRHPAEDFAAASDQVFVDATQAAFDVALPPGKTVACGVQCDAGTYRRAPMRECGYCPPGTHSVRGEIYGGWRTDRPELWPENFHTRCFAENPEVRQWECSGWAQGDGVLHSGHQPAGRDTVSLLNILVNIKTEPANLRFQYKTDVEADSRFYVTTSGKFTLKQTGPTSGWVEHSSRIQTQGCSLMLTANRSNDPSVSLGTYCVHRNLFEPYSPSLHFGSERFTSTALSDAYHMAGDGCTPDEFDGLDLFGRLVLLHRDRRRRCQFVTKVQRAQEAGAVGVIVLDYSATATYMTGNSTNLTIPAVSMKGSDSDKLLKALFGNETLPPLASTFSPMFGRFAEVPLYPSRDFAGFVSVGVGQNTVAPGLAWIQLQLYSTARPPPGVARKVYLKEIVVEGTQFAADSCSECPAGTRSLPFARGCKVCRAGTYSKAGSSACTPCRMEETSDDGSARCERVRTCEAADYLPLFSACDAATSTTKVSWFPFNCVEGRGAPAAPAPASTACICSVQADGACAPCKEGTVPSTADGGGKGGCRACGEEQVVERVDTFEGFARLAPSLQGQHSLLVREEVTKAVGDASFAGRVLWTTRCAGECSPGVAWTLRATEKREAPWAELSVGSETETVQAENELSYAFTAVVPGTIEFTASARAPLDSLFTRAQQRAGVRLGFRLVAEASGDDGGVDPEEENNVHTLGRLPFARSGAPVTHTTSFEAGRYRAVWTYSTGGSAVVQRVTLHSLVVKGTASGRGVSCGQCPAGYSCGLGAPEVCPLGLKRSPEDPPKKCLLCAGEKVPSPSRRATECVDCLEGLTRRGDGPNCVPLTPDVDRHHVAGVVEPVDKYCTLRVGEANRKYDLRQLAGRYALKPKTEGVAALRFNFGCPLRNPQSAEEKEEQLLRRGEACADPDALVCSERETEGGGEEVVLGSTLVGIEGHEANLTLHFDSYEPCEGVQGRTRTATVRVLCGGAAREGDEGTRRSAERVLALDARCHVVYNVYSPAGCTDCEHHREITSKWSRCEKGVRHQVLDLSSAPAHCLTAVELARANSKPKYTRCESEDVFGTPKFLVPVILVALLLVSIGGVCAVIQYKQYKLLHVQVCATTAQLLSTIHPPCTPRAPIIYLNNHSTPLRQATATLPSALLATPARKTCSRAPAWP